MSDGSNSIFVVDPVIELLVHDFKLEVRCCKELYLAQLAFSRTLCRINAQHELAARDSMLYLPLLPLPAAIPSLGLVFLLVQVDWSVFIVIFQIIQVPLLGVTIGSVICRFEGIMCKDERRVLFLDSDGYPKLFIATC